MNDSMIGGVVHYRITADDSEFRSSVDSADSRAQELASSLNSGIGNAAQQGFQKAADAALSFATSAVNAISGVVDSVNSMVNSVQGAFEKISGVNLPSPSTDYLTSALSTGVEMSSTIEGATKGISIMTKDTARAEAIMDSVVDKATKTTFNVANLLQYTQQIGSAAGGDYEGALDAALAYGGAMVAAGNGLRDMGLVVRNIQQGYARGYNSVDLRQMKTYIPQFKQIMEQAGLTDEMIIEMGTDGAKAVTDALTAWVAAENIWEEYEFTYGNLKESLNEMLQTVTYEAVTESGLFDAIKSAMVQIKNNMPILKEGLKDIGGYVAEIVNNVDWAGVLRGVSSGIHAIVTTISAIWKVVQTMLKALGGGDVAKGIERFIPLLTTVTIGVKGLKGALNTLNTVRGVFTGFTNGAQAFSKALGPISKVSGGGGKALSGLTSVALSVLAFVTAIWVLNKMDLGDFALLIPKLALVAGCMVAMEAIAKLASKFKVTSTQVKNLTLLAAPIATFAASLWIVNKAIPDDMSQLIPKLGIVALCITAMGALALAAKKVKITVTQIKNLILLAVPLAAFGAALWLVDQAIPNDFGNFAIKLGIVGVVIVALGALCVAAGALSEFILPGATMIVAMAIAIASIGAGLMIAALGLAEASKAVDQIKLDGLVKFIGILGVVSALLTLITAFAVFGAVGAIASAIIGGGLLFSAVSLAEAQTAMAKVKISAIEDFMNVLACVSLCLTAIAVFATFGAVGAVATAIIGGGLLLTALALAQTQEYTKKIDTGEMERFLNIIGLVDMILASLLPFAVLGAISTIATDIIIGGLLVAAKGLRDASEVAGEIKEENLQKLVDAITCLAELQTGSLWNNLVNMINTGILVKVADNVKQLSETLANVPLVKTKNIEKIKSAVSTFASIATGDLWNNLTNLINSGMLVEVAENTQKMSKIFNDIKPVKIETVEKLKKAVETFSQIKIEGNGLFEDKGGTSAMLVTVARNVRRISDLLSNLPNLPDSERVNKLKEVINNFSQIKIEGNGLFENKGEAASQLYTVAFYVYRIAYKLSQIPTIDEEKISKFITCINKFKDVSGEARDGILRLKDLGDALGNINWIKYLFGDIETKVSTGANILVNALVKFKKVTSEVRSGILRLKDLGDSLGNIDWMKKILGDVPGDLSDKVKDFTTALAAFKNIDEGTRKSIRELNNLGDALGNIDWMKKILGDIPGDLADKVGDFVNAIKKFNDLDNDTRKGIRELKDLGDSLGNIDWIKHIIGDIPDSIGKNVENFVNAIKKFNEIDENTRKHIRGLRDLGDALGNIDWIKHIIWDIPDTTAEKVGTFVEAIKKFNDIDSGTRRKIRELNELGDSLGNLDWIKKILGDLQEKWPGVENFVGAIKMFDRIDSKVRTGILKLNSLGDSLGNIDWLKKILGDLQEKWTGVENFVGAIKMFDRIDLKVRTGIMRLADLSDSLGNIDWIKKILGDLQDSWDNTGKFVDAIVKFKDISNEVRDGFRRLADLGDCLGNIDWIKKILGDLQENWDNSGKFVDAVVKFKDISEDVRAGLTRLSDLGDCLSNIDWIKHIFGDVPEGLKEKADALIDSIVKFKDITDEVKAGIERLTNLGEDSLENVEWMKRILTEVPDNIVDNATRFVEAVNKFSELKVNEENLQSISEAVNNLVETVKNTVATLPDIMIKSGEESVDSFIKGFSSKINDAKDQGAAMANSLKEGLLSVNNALKEAGYKAQGSYWSAIQEKMQDEYYQGQAMGKQFRQGLYDIDYANSGWWAVQGFINGANNRNYGGAAWWVGYNIAKNFLDGLRTAGGEGSPWKTTFKSGRFAGEGFALGIESSLDKVEEAMEKMADLVNTELETINPSITTGNVDIDGVTTSAGTSNNVKNITMNNNIYNDLDLSSMMSQLRWEMARA